MLLKILLLFSLVLIPTIPFFMSLALIASLEKPLLIVLEKLGFKQIIREEGPESHKTKSSTPTAGGIIFPVSLVVAAVCLLCCAVIFKNNNIDWTKLSLIIFVTFISGLIGFADDFLMKVKKQNEGLKPSQKFLAQAVVSIIIFLILGRSSSNFFGTEIELGYFLPILIFFVISGTMNATNLTDGLDGLASSVLAWSYLGLAGIIYCRAENVSIALLSIESIFLCLSLAGLCFGFLKLNGHPAKVFMGDTGSFFLGGGLAIIALVNNLEWYLLVLAIVPIWETISVILQIVSCKISKRFLGKDLRPFRMTPFHHHLELCGWKEKQIVFVMSLVQFLFSLLLVYFLWK